MSPTTLAHEAPLEILRKAPEAALGLLRLVGQPAPPGVTVDVLDSELTEAVPSVRRADLVILLRDGETVVRGIIIEVQRDRDQEKRLAWPQYVTYLHATYGAPVTLLVVSFDEDVCVWARTRYELGPNMAFAPTVVGPSDLPTIATIEQALEEPDLAVLTALAHIAGRDAASVARHEAEVARVFEAMLRTEESHARWVRISLLHGIASDALRATMGELMEAHGMGALEIIYNEGEAKGRAEGRAEGEAKGKAEALLTVLASRGLRVNADVERRIRENRDLGRLDVWLTRAVTAASVDEVFQS